MKLTFLNEKGDISVEYNPTEKKLLIDFDKANEQELKDIFDIIKKHKKDIAFYKDKEAKKFVLTGSLDKVLETFFKQQVKAVKRGEMFIVNYHSGDVKITVDDKTLVEFDKIKEILHIKTVTGRDCGEKPEDIQKFIEEFK